MSRTTRVMGPPGQDEAYASRVAAQIPPGDAASAAVGAASPLPQPGERVGAYRIERLLGAGGMGVVYLAWRDDGLYIQRVAIKLVQPSQWLLAPALRDGLLARFEEERAILAQLRHPNIVRILDGGRTAQGLPYLVMDFVDGMDLMRHCRERGLDVAARIDLFCRVCEAVQEAHRHLVVHRDLKPGNVLVDDEGTPHLLDFGIAKLLDPLRAGDAPDRTQTTVLGAMTPAYASPEQIQRRALTTRSDIYSLGVMLFQLLSGKRPYDTDDLSPAQIERAICETQPPSLAHALSHADADAGYRPMPAKLPQDLERIVGKALHKAPERRYGSAQELADDLRRYRRGQPVQAQPDTLAYRLFKFVGRHRFGSALGALSLVLVLGASAVAWVQAHQARIEAATSDEINAFLLEILTRANIDHTGTEPGMGDVLEAVAARLDLRFGDRPAIAAGVRHAIGSSLLNLGRLDAAGRQLESGLAEARAAFGDAHLETWQGADALALLRAEQGRYSEGIALLENVLQAMRAGGQEGIGFYVTACNNLGYLYMVQEQYAQAFPPVAEAVAAIEQRGVHVPADEYANVLANFGQIQHDLGELDAADSAYARAAALLRERYPGGSRDLAILLNNRALLARDRGQGEEALALLSESVQMRRDSYRGDHPVIVFGLTNLARLALSESRPELALPAAREAAEMAQRLFPDGSEDKAMALGALAQALAHRQDLDAARAALGRAHAALAGVPEPSARVIDYLETLAGELGRGEVSP